jgi:hypothetical protein
MTFTDLLSELDKLNRTEKLRVIQHLAEVLEREDQAGAESSAIQFGHEYEVWSPQDEGGATKTLQKLLRDHKQLIG